MLPTGEEPSRVFLLFRNTSKDNGYYVCGSGKIFHHHKDWAFHDNTSFNEFLMMAINEPYPENKINGPD
jgi:hypothetical protein